MTDYLTSLAKEFIREHVSQKFDKPANADLLAGFARYIVHRQIVDPMEYDAQGDIPSDRKIGLLAFAKSLRRKFGIGG